MKKRWGLLLVAAFLATGCLASHPADEGTLSGAALSEPEWIHNGEPIEFEGEMWYPIDEVESLLDPEVYLAGEYRGVPFFTDRTDVKPYSRLYTHFGKNRYRAFEKRSHD